MSGRVDVQGDLDELYAKALQMAEEIEAEWVARDKPLLTEGGATGSALVPHPLVKMLAEARRDVDRFSKALKAAHRGPKPSAVVERSIGKSPETKLRVAK